MAEERTPTRPLYKLLSSNTASVLPDAVCTVTAPVVARATLAALPLVARRVETLRLDELFAAARDTVPRVAVVRTGVADVVRDVVVRAATTRELAASARLVLTFVADVPAAREPFRVAVIRGLTLVEATGFVVATVSSSATTSSA